MGIQVKDKDGVIHEIEGFEMDFQPLVKAIKETQENSSAKLAEQINMYLDSDKVWKAKLAEVLAPVKQPDTPKDPKDTAEMKESMTSTFKSATKEIVPVAIGGIASIFFTELIDGIYTNMGKGAYWKGGTKAVAAVLIWKWGDKIPFLGKTGKNIAAALIAFDALRSLIPAIPNMVSAAANKVSGAIPTGGLGGQRTGEINRGGVINQAQQILTSSQRMAMR